MNAKQTLLIAFTVVGISFFAAPTVLAAQCNDVQTSIIDCGASAGKDDNGDGVVDDKDVSNSGVWKLLVMVIQIMTAGVGVLAVAGIVYGAVLYTSAGGSPEQVKKAITIFTNVAIGVLAYALMYALLNFIIPGGLFA